MCLVGDRRQHAERVDAAAIYSPETVLIGCLAGACGFGSLDCELIRDFSRCGRLVLCPMFFVSASSSSRVLSRMCCCGSFVVVCRVYFRSRAARRLTA
jgi:hypothetical protein